MLIHGKRIRSVDRYLPQSYANKKIVIGLKEVKSHLTELKRCGFSESLALGEALLPAGVFGPISSFNAEGKYIKHTDQPMETAYRMVEWHWTEYHGDDRVEQSKIVDVPYQRYPRSFISPPSVEMEVASSVSSEKIVMTKPIVYSDQNKEKILHVINLFLEIFSECYLFTEDLSEIIQTKVKRLNWEILPQGQRPWAQLRENLKPLIEEAPKGNQEVIEYRLQKINKYKPDFAAVGVAGFRGYIILGFTAKNMYVLESLYHGNATYVFGDKWESLSKLTKAEILSGNLQKDRIIHRASWEGKVNHLLK